MSVTKLRCDLYVNGYRPVAIKNGLKFPTDKAWTDRARRDPPAVISEPFKFSHSGTGILCDGLRAIDIDIANTETVGDIGLWCMEHFGDAPIRRRTNSERILMLYKAAEDSPKKAKIWNGETKEGVEVLGHGQQFFAFGTHPSGAKLEWAGDLGPDVWPVKELAAVSEQQIEDLLEFARAYVGEDAKKTHRIEPIDFDPTDPEVSIEDIRLVLDGIPNIYCDYDWWLSIAMAVYRCSGGSGEGYEAWRAWSSQNPEHRDRDAAKVWRALASSPPNKVTFGSLIHYAREADPEFQLGSALQRLNRRLIQKYKRMPMTPLLKK